MSENKKILWYMKIKVIPIIIAALGTVPKGLEMGLKELEIGRIETIHTTRIPKTDQNSKKKPGDLQGDTLLLKLEWKIMN